MARFENQYPFKRKGFGAVFRWLLSRRLGAWPEWIKAPSRKVPHERVERGLSFTYINHSTVLIQYEGVNLLTDPIFAQRASPIPFLGPKRVQAPGVALEDLPHIDVVLISHNHYDHLDRFSVRRLWKRYRPLFVVPLGDAPLLRRWGVSEVEALEWWQWVQCGDLKIHFVPAQHFSGRTLWDTMNSLWGGFVIEHPTQGPVYFAGDTAEGPHDLQIRERFGPMRLSFIPIGAYEPWDIMQHSHINPEQAVLLHERLESRRSVAIHYKTFRGLTDEAYDDPQKRLYAALAARGLHSDVFLTPEFGETLEDLPC